MLKTYEIHPAHDVAIAANDLRRAIRRLSDDDEPNIYGLGLAADMADLIADVMGRYWQSIRPTLDA